MPQTRNNIHFSFYLWTSNNFIAFVALIAYYIDDNGQFQIILISFYWVIWSNFGEVIVEQMIGLFQEYGIEKKVDYFVFDNATSNNTCVEAIFKAIQLDLSKKEQKL